MRNRRKPIDSALSVVGENRFQTKCRSFVDGLDVLRINGMSVDGKFARVVSVSLILPSGELVAFVGLVGDDLGGPSVTFPACCAIRGSDTYNNRALYDPALFENATIDDMGNVDLQDGTCLHSCEIIPMRLPSNWSAEKHRVVNLAICFLKAEDRCFFEVDWQSYPERTLYPWAEQVRYIPAREPEPGTRPQTAFINYAAVCELSFSEEKLEAFVAYCRQHTPVLKQRLSRQTIANILRDAGIRMPQSGRHTRHSGAVSAPIRSLSI